MAKGRRQSTARQFKRGHFTENGGRRKNPLIAHNNRKPTKGRKGSVQLVTESFVNANGRQTGMTRTVKLIRHMV